MYKVKMIATMKRRLNRHRRNVRYWFPSPAEMKLVELMGGKVLRFERIRYGKNKFPLSIVIWRGWLFWRERVKREVYVRGYYADFMNDIGRIIEVDGDEWHDAIYDSERDYHLKKSGCTILRVRAYDIYKHPELVRNKVKHFLVK